MENSPRSFDWKIAITISAMSGSACSEQGLLELSHDLDNYTIAWSQWCAATSSVTFRKVFNWFFWRDILPYLHEFFVFGADIVILVKEWFCSKMFLSLVIDVELWHFLLYFLGSSSISVLINPLSHIIIIFRINIIEPIFKDLFEGFW